MRVALIPMSQAVYDLYMKEHLEDYAQDRTRTDFESIEEARATIAKSMRAKLPDGLQSRHNHFYVAVDTETELPVGKVWLKVEPDTGVAWLFHILIEPSERRKGYGRAVMETIFAKSKELGGRVFWLNVFEHNPGALALYKSVGLNVVTHHLNKLL